MSDLSPNIDFGSLIDRPVGVTMSIPESLGDIPGQALVHLISAGVDPPDWIETLGRMATKLDNEDQRLALMSSASAAIHGLRHFHDLLLTPWGKHVAAKIQSVAAAFEALSTQLAKVASFNLPLKNAQEPLPPELAGPAEELSASLERAYAAVGRSPSYPDSPLEVRHLFEAAAMSVQSEFFTRAFGMGRAVGFAREISGRTDAEAYTRCWAMFNSVADQIAPGRRFDPAAANGLLYWSLCAEPGAPGDLTHPVDRLNGALAYILHHKQLPEADSVIAMLDGMSEVFGLPRVLETAPTPIRQAPHDYFDPGRYLEHAGRWPAAPVWVIMPANLGGSVFARHLQDAGWRAFGMAGGRVLVLSALSRTGVQELSAEEAGRTSILLWMAATLVSGGRLESLLSAAARSGLEERFPNAVIETGS
jgi:hypothetical protein